MHKKYAIGISIISLVVVLVAMVLPGCGTPEPAATTPAQEEPSGPIKYGMLTDLTGPTAASSKPSTDATVDYFDYLNSKGGIKGHEYEIIVVDTKYDVNLAVTGFEKLVNQDKVGYVYGNSANFQSVLKPLAKKYKVTYVGLTDQAALLPVTPDMYNFGIGATYSDMYRNSLNYFKDNWKKSDPPRIGIMGVDAAFSKSTIKTCKYMLEKELKWPLVAEEYMTMSSTDASSQVTNLKNAKCDYILLISTGVPQIVFLKTAKSMGLSDQSVIIDTFLSAIDAYRAAARDAMEGLIVHVTCADASMADKFPQIKDMEKLQKEKRPNVTFDWLSVANYGVVQIFDEICRRGLDKYGYAKLDGTAFKNVCETMAGFDAGGIFAPSVWSPTSHDGPKSVIIVKNKPNSGFEPLSMWYKVPPWPEESRVPSFWMD